MLIMMHTYTHLLVRLWHPLLMCIKLWEVINTYTSLSMQYKTLKNFTDCFCYFKPLCYNNPSSSCIANWLWYDRACHVNYGWIEECHCS